MPTVNLQNLSNFQGQKFYVGIDVHRKSWTVTVRSLNLHLQSFTQPPSCSLLMNHLKSKYPNAIFYSVYEAGFCGTTLHEQLIKAGIHNIIVNPADIPLTDKQAKNKSDVHDSRSLAFHLEKGNLTSIYIMDKKQQELRSLFRLRQTKMKDLTRSINRLKGFLYYCGVDCSSIFDGNEHISNRILNRLNQLNLKTYAGTLVLKQHIADINYQRKQLLSLTRTLRMEVQQIYSSAYKSLLSIPGVGSITAMALLTEIGDFNRFTNHSEYCSFLGLLPWSDSSGDNKNNKGIQPRCNKYLRPLIVEASWIAIRKQPALLGYYRKHVGKNSKHAIIKVARKLALMAKAVAQTLKPYQADYYLIQKSNHPLI